MKYMIKNKKGASLSAWSEVALCSVLIIALLVILSIQMNGTYGKSHDLSFGMSGVSNSTLTDLKGYQGTLQTGAKGDTLVSSITGVNLLTVWSMIKGGVEILFNFITGNWIEPLIGLLPFGEAGAILALILRIAFVFSIGFIIIKLIMKVRP
jgi:hypothetical protein